MDSFKAFSLQPGNIVQDIVQGYRLVIHMLKDITGDEDSDSRFSCWIDILRFVLVS